MCMEKTERVRKEGCILLLGNKGNIGITYEKCDVTISLDDGHIFDNQIQRWSRSLTEATGKTIGINVDMNIQRVYNRLLNLIQKNNQRKTYDETLKFLYKQKIFIYNPQEFNFGVCKESDIKKNLKNLSV